MIVIKTKMKEMPSTCDECPFSYQSENYMSLTISCNITKEHTKPIKTFNGIKFEVPDSCPLREI